jgi:hypothetical protein
MSAKEPTHIRAIGSFLADCLAARDIYNGSHKSNWQTTARRQYLVDYTHTPPSDSTQSSRLLRALRGCDIHSPCIPVSAQLRILDRVARQYASLVRCALVDTTRSGVGEGGVGLEEGGEEGKKRKTDGTGNYNAPNTPTRPTHNSNVTVAKRQGGTKERGAMATRGAMARRGRSLAGPGGRSGPGDGQQM